MKKVLCILFFAQLTFLAHTQITLADMYVGFLAQDKDSFAAQDRWNIDLTHEQWLKSPKGVEQKPVSFGFGLNRMFDFSISRNHSFAFGIGMHWLHHYNNSTFFRINIPGEGNKDTVMPIPNRVDYTVNKYVMNFIDFNTELRLRFGHNRNVKFYLGFRGSYLLGNRFKYKDASVKFKRNEVHNFSTINYGPTARIGIGRISIYGCYLLKPVYLNDKKQEIDSFSVGLSFFLL